MIERLIDNPRPMPPGLDVTKDWKRRLVMSGASPAPVSLTATSTPAAHAPAGGLQGILNAPRIQPGPLDDLLEFAGVEPRTVAGDATVDPDPVPPEPAYLPKEHTGRLLRIVRLTEKDRILVFDFPNLTSQGRALNRLAVLVEKPDAPRDRVLSDAQLAEVVLGDVDPRSVAGLADRR